MTTVGDYHGRPTRRLDTAHLWVEALATAGPRIVRLGRAGSDENLLAETPGDGWDTPFGRYELFGGHRLWYAPEDPERGAVPDVDGLMFADGPETLRLTGRVEAPTGLVRTIAIEVLPGGAALSVCHELCNAGESPIELAPWSISQLPLGGTVILPQAAARVAHDVRPNRNLVLWPYTSWTDERLGLHDGAVVVSAVAGADLKVGYFNDAGWIAYLHGDTALVRRFEPARGRPHPDLGCNVETYSGPRYLELEVLGPLVTLAPGEATVLVERWELLAPPDSRPSDLAALSAMLSGSPTPS
jgi:hypothetical protein